MCRIAGCVRRATDTEHGNRTVYCDQCCRTNGRFHTSVCDAADYDLDVSSSSAASTLVGTDDTSKFIPGWHNCSLNNDGGGASGAAKEARSERLWPLSATSETNTARSEQRTRALSCIAAAYLARLPQQAAATATRRKLYTDRTATMIRVCVAFGVRGTCSAIVSRQTTARTLRW